MTCQLSDARPEFAKSLTPQSACCSMTLGLTPLSRQFVRGDTLRSLLNDQLQSQPTNTLPGYLSVLEQLIRPLFPQHHLKCSPTSWSAALSLPSSTPSPPTFKSAKPSTVPVYVTEMTDNSHEGQSSPELRPSGRRPNLHIQFPALHSGGELFQVPWLHYRRGWMAGSVRIPMNSTKT